MTRRSTTVGLGRKLWIAAIWTCSLYSLAWGTEYRIERQNAIVRAVQKVSPAVVNISSEVMTRNRSHPFAGLEMDSFFDSFFKDFFDPDFDRHSRRTSLGSGVIIDGRRGLLITNAHVIANRDKIKIVLMDEREFEAQIVGADADYDLAVLRIEALTPLPAVEMGNSADLMIGESVIAIGNPFGFSHTVTTGVISALNRSIRADMRTYHQFIQTDASINPGNSGGPLLNIHGDLIGINTAIYAKAQGIGFAIPIDRVKKVIAELIEYGELVQPWIGISVQDLDRRLAQYLNLPYQQGVVIRAIEPASPAQKAGLKEHDLVLSLGGRGIYSADDYQTAMRGFSPGDIIPVEIMRRSDKKAFSVHATHFPMHLAKPLSDRLLGISVAPITETNRRRYGLSASKGVVITGLQKDTYLAQMGVRPGDVIRQIDEMKIASPDDYYKAVVKYRHKKSWIVLIQRGNQGYYVAVNL